LICPNGLPTFVAHVPNLSKKIVVMDKKKDMPLLKKPKKNYDILRKCKNA
jgi:hypothetical protein